MTNAVEISKCHCGCARLIVEAVMVSLPGGGIAGETLGPVTCEECGDAVPLNAYTEITMMDHLLATRGVPEPIER